VTRTDLLELELELELVDVAVTSPNEERLDAVEDVVREVRCVPLEDRQSACRTADPRHGSNAARRRE
jgi:hypothetical protein